MADDNLQLITQALPLPTGLIRQVTPSVVWQQRVYAYDLHVQVGQLGIVRVDARQLPIAIPALQGQYGEVGLYATALTQVRAISQPVGAGAAQYLGEQLSLVFFADLLARYRVLQQQHDLPDELYPDEDGIAEFQDAYAERLEAHTSI
jgi:hypothetical protein